MRITHKVNYELKIDFGAESGMLEFSVLVDGEVLDKASIAYES
jgi:hypothetical protein